MVCKTCARLIDGRCVDLDLPVGNLDPACNKYDGPIYEGRYMYKTDADGTYEEDDDWDYDDDDETVGDGIEEDDDDDWLYDDDDDDFEDEDYVS